MSDKLILALQAATVRMMQHRKVLRHATVLLRVYPEGLVFACQLVRDSEGMMKFAGGRAEVPWHELPTFDAAAAIEVVDRICEGAHRQMGTKLEPEPQTAIAAMH